jgi:hypothetical protein
VQRKQKIPLSMLQIIAVPPGHVFTVQAPALGHAIVALLHGSLKQ